MRIFALELNNEIKGIPARKQYIESLVAQLPDPDLVLLPELAVCSYMASREIWQYADRNGRDTAQWAMALAEKYHTCMGVGYLDYENGDYYNRYLIADGARVFGAVSKSEGESAVFKRGRFDPIIKTPFGNVAVGTCYDAKRKHFYNRVKDEALALIVFPHGCPADPKTPEREIAANDYFCGLYQQAFGVPVVYVNSVGPLEYMPGMMGRLMARAGFCMNGRSKLYHQGGRELSCGPAEAVGVEITPVPGKLSRSIPFYGDDLLKGNRLFRLLVLQPDTRWGLRLYKKRVSPPAP